MSSDSFYIAWVNKPMNMDFWLVLNDVFLSCLSVVFSKESWLRHIVVWLFANHGRCDSAARGSCFWKVSFCYSYFCLHIASHRLLFANFRNSCQTMQINVTAGFCFVGRFADLFGARMALSLVCTSTIVFFLLLATAKTPAMLFIHKLPTVFMHILPGEHHSYYFYIDYNLFQFSLYLSWKKFHLILLCPASVCSVTDGRYRPFRTWETSRCLIQTRSVLWYWYDSWLHIRRTAEQTLWVSAIVCIIIGLRIINNSIGVRPTWGTSSSLDGGQLGVSLSSC